MSGGHKIDIFVDGFIDILSHDSEHQYLVHSPDQNGTTLLASTSHHPPDNNSPITNNTDQTRPQKLGQP